MRILISGKGVFLRTSLYLQTVFTPRLMMAVLLIAALQATAAAQTIRGIVHNEKSEPLSGVSVSVQRTSRGTTTDGKGEFSLRAQAGDSLEFNMVGYRKYTVAVTAESRLNITLSEDAANLTDMVVVGYSSKKVKYLSSAVSVISSEKLQDVTSNDLGSLIQGKAPGVVASNNSGDPTSGATLLVRGAGSINAGTGPLVVVDGNIGGTYNPTDVETVTILKDAAATGLYGSRAANGVLIVTTKSGKSGKPKINVNATVGFNNATTGNFKLMNSQQLYDYQKLFTNPDPAVLNTNTNWWDLAFRTGITNNHTLSASGGSDKTQYYISGNFYSEQGTLLDNSKTGYNFRTNVTTKLSNRLKLSVLFNSIYTKDNYSNSNTLYDAYLNLPFDSAYNADGSPRDGRTPSWIGRDHENFLQSLQYNFSNDRSINTSGDLNLDYTISKHFTFSTYNRATLYSYKSVSYNDARTKQGAANSGELYYGENYSSRLLTSNRLKYDNSFGKNNLTVLAVAEAERNYYDDSYSSGKGLPPGRAVMSVATDIINNPSGGIDEYSFQKYLGQADYNFDNRYFAVASFVHEESSRFGNNKPGADFYQFGGSWLLSNEAFFQHITPINFLKLRASYGTTGNADIGNYAARGLYSIDQSASYGNLPGAYPSQKANPDLTWEKTKAVNIGIDISFFKRIDLSVDAYQKTSSALLFQKPLPATSGYSYIFENAGSVRNRGIEFNLTTRNLVGAFRWETNFNIAFNRNKVLSLADGTDMFLPGYQQPIAVGHDINAWNMPIWAGVNPANGDPQWVKITTDASGKEVRSLTNNYSDASTAQSRQFTGTSAAPKFTGGIGNTFSYKQFELSAFFNFVSGNQVYNDSRFYFDNDGVYDSYNAMVLKKGWTRWAKPGDIATHPLPIQGGNHNSNSASSRYLEDGSYLRLRNVRLSYDLPPAFLNRAKIASFRVFVSADNLWTWTKFSGVDPEVVINPYTSNSAAGTSSFKYPISRKILFGIALTF